MRLTADGGGSDRKIGMEDNAALAARKRGDEAGLLQFKRNALPGTASMPTAAYLARWPVPAGGQVCGFQPSLHNAHRVGMRWLPASWISRVHDPAPAVGPNLPC